MDIQLPKTPENGEIYKHKSNSMYYYRWNGFAWETISYVTDSSNTEGISNFTLQEIINETPTEIADSKRIEFKLKYSPIKNTESVYLHGMLQKEGENYDYKLLGNSLYFNEAPLEGSIIIFNYFIRSLISIKNEMPKGKNDGKNSNFFLLGAPAENSEKIFLNGLLQKNGLDYIIDNNKIIFNEIPMENSKIICFYETFVS
jgi:hypothetical protein